MGIFDPQTDLNILPEPETLYREDGDESFQPDGKFGCFQPDSDDLQPCDQRRLTALGRAKLRSAAHGASDSPVSVQTTRWKQHRKLLIGFRRRG